MKKRVVALACGAAAWVALMTSVVSGGTGGGGGTCYQLTDLGAGCGLVPITAPECVVSTSVNLTVNGYQTGSPGMTKVTCKLTVVCKRALGKLDSRGNCVSSGVTNTLETLTCSLSGNAC